ncbi:MAG: carbamoyltransferase [Nitrospira sp. SCN 59-13]|nr:MAG: carbamoyltransferase [Nitrospira sp. SCN 59-13]
MQKEPPILYTLGINAAFHDSAACLVRDGLVLAAAEEERFTRIKHGKRPIPFSAYELPHHAIHYCLQAAGLCLRDVDHVAYAYDPLIRLGDHAQDTALPLPLQPSAHPESGEWESVWEPLFLSSIMNAPGHLADGAPHHLQARFAGATSAGPFRWHFVSHHRAHAASAFFPSPFEEAAVLTLDGRGEQATTTYHHGSGYQLNDVGQVTMPHSLGLLYEDLTTYLGFLHSSDEYKVMALASYGKPRFADEFRRMIRLDTSGRYEIEPARLTERFGPARPRGGPMEEKHYDLARSLQTVLEETALALATWLHDRTGADQLCMAGGVALNCVMNAYLRDHAPYRSVWVQPAAGDAGTALGAALLIDAQERGARGSRAYRMDHALLGPSFTDAEIESYLRRTKITYRRMQNVAEQTAQLLSEDRIVGWFQGRMEFGPRALGARSILASPLHATMQERLNELKDREDFRPVAPAVLEESAADWFEGAEQPSPFMLFTFQIVPHQAYRIPAVRHVDGTARVQTVSREHQPLYYELLKAFERQSGVPVLINTSFNTRGAPIVCTPRDAMESFYTSPLDDLVLGPFLLSKR